MRASPGAGSESTFENYLMRTPAQWFGGIVRSHVQGCPKGSELPTVEPGGRGRGGTLAMALLRSWRATGG